MRLAPLEVADHRTDPRAEQRLLVVRWRTTEHAMERPRHLWRAPPGEPCQGAQLETAVRLCRQRAAEIAHQLHLGVGGPARGLAAATGAEAHGFRRFGDRKEPHLRAARPTAGAGGTALGAGRGHWGDE